MSKEQKTVLFLQAYASLLELERMRALNDSDDDFYQQLTLRQAQVELHLNDLSDDYDQEVQQRSWMDESSMAGNPDF